MDYDEIWTFILSFTIFTSLTTMLAACLCCRKKVPKSSNAPHRSLPDIPASDQAAVDTNSDLYATVGDKVQGRPQGRSPSSLKKQSVSQHSSLSQADDVSSPYASVRSPSHAYDKIRKTEHPYAQLQPNQSNPPADHNGMSRRASNESLLGTNEPTGADIPAASAIAGRISASQELPYMTPPIAQPQHFSGDSQDSSKGYTSISVREPLANIIAQTNKQNAQTRRRDLSDSHYATVSDDSDEMYAAIDDPNNPADLYTSGSETYAQIQPPNAMVVSVEINTPATARNEDQVVEVASPQQNIDIPAPSLVDNFRAQATVHSRQASSSSVTSSIGILGSPKPEKRQANSPLPPTPKSGKTVAHYASSNSNLTSTSSTQSGRNSVASVVDTHQLMETKGETLQPGDDDQAANKCKKSPSKDLEGMYAKVMKKNKLSNLPSQNSSPQMGRKFPQSDRASTAEPEVFISDSDISNGTPATDSGRVSVHESPGKYSVRSAGHIDNNYETIERKLSRGRSSSYGEKDPGYETIPGDKRATERDVVDAQSRSSAPPGLIAPIEVLKTANNRSGYLFSQPMEDPGYEIVKQRGISTSDYDPNYEVLRPARDEDGYSRIWDKGGEKGVNRLSGGDLLDGYSSIKAPRKVDDCEAETDSDVPGYSSIQDVKKMAKGVDIEPGYSIICDKGEGGGDAMAKKINASINNNNILDDSDIYSSIPHSENPSYLSIQDNVHNYSTIGETPSSSQTLISSPGYSSISDTLTATTTPSSESMSSDQVLFRSHMQTTSSNYESLTGSESDPNYETVRYLGVKENPYERLHNEKASSPECHIDVKRPNDATGGGGGGGGGGGNHISGNGPIPAANVEGQEVSDYFQV
ncbi:uro-adherence factor A isoform X2 [Phlebotomus papatasi]|uniref:uro-adherence factor A isoform X2 n=1 Tax=Phlebotomus papatasi TaxID=29031 RepID=UPI00248360C1|nr:uro-adherence factor A isoform X2 [Phlebotomus papatasi]